ncbi:MAG: copper amine oxidase N-terminal domain-containing protein [Candidatus Eremiobacteraeota bacterium]|nr:copper amine oxidase N-terminal domain-containing protein [Candidatus Eremiobacteraeota bacterium]
MPYRAPNGATIALTAAVALLASAMFALSRPVIIRVDGERVDSDVPPITTAADHAYVPLRSLADALGAETSTDGANIYVVRGHRSLRIKVGDTHAAIDGRAFTLRHAPFRVRGRVMIGLKPVAEAFDVRATYDPRTARIDVQTPGIGQAGAAATPSAE